MVPRGLLVSGRCAVDCAADRSGAADAELCTAARNRSGISTRESFDDEDRAASGAIQHGAKEGGVFQRSGSRAGELPGVRAAAVAMSLPTTTIVGTNISKVEGQPDPDYTVAANFATIESVTPGYFRALGIEIRRGREFTERDNTKGAAPVIIVNEHLARQFWPDYPRGIDPVGRHIAEDSINRWTGSRLWAWWRIRTKVALERRSHPSFIFPARCIRRKPRLSPRALKAIP